MVRMITKILVDTLIIIITIGYSQSGFCQKHLIDTSSYGKFIHFAFGVGNKISNDGKYAVIKTTNTILTSTTGNRKIELHPSSDVYFTSNGEAAYYMDAKQMVHKIRLSDFNDSVIDSAKAIKLFGTGNSEWLALEYNEQPQTLRLVNTSSKRQLVLSYKNYLVNNKGNNLLILSAGHNQCDQINLLNLQTGKQQTIWENRNVTNLAFDDSGNRCTFSSMETGNDNRSVWYFQPGYSKAEKIVDAASLTAMNLELDHINGIDISGSYVFLVLKETSTKVSNKNNTSFKIWSYNDKRLQSNRENEQEPVYDQVAIEVATKRFIPITGKNVDPPAMFNTSNSPIRLFNSQIQGHGTIEESNWNKSTRTSFKILDIRSGTTDSIASKKGIWCSSLSPDKRFVVYCKLDDTSYHSFDLKKRIDKVIAKGIAFCDTEHELPFPSPRLIGGWYENSQRVVLYDNWDIWAVDPNGEKAPVNLTNGYGKSHRIIFRPALEKDQNNLGAKNGQSLILSAFNRDTKDNGYFRVTIGNQKDPEKLYMGPYIFEMPVPISELNAGPYPQKALNAEAYLVTRQSEKDAPNYFFTKDFRNFTRLTDEQPQKKYNWLSTELINWQLPDGTETQGILYKPEDFDPSKKYPVIFYYYEKLSDQLHAFQDPDWARGRLDIPTYVSNGYLVFTPDIHYKLGMPMQCALNTIETAVDELAKRPYIDSTKYGLQGHSFGGFQTDYIVTHSHRFAAACSASGLSNLISSYGSLISKTVSQQGFYEMSQARAGASLWERPDIYLNNSSILSVDKVSSPLLLMHTDEDGICLFTDAIQFFTGLRRMGKRAWMLEYDGDNHSLGNLDHAKDFTTRMQQFFDHYLKGAPAPKWMVEAGNISLELEPAGVEPGPNLLTKEEQEKVDSLISKPPFNFSFKQ